MAVSIQMIEDKEFKYKMRGYDPMEVDEFLDDICDEMEAMQSEIESLQSRLAKSGSRIFSSSVPAPVVPTSAIPAPPVQTAPPVQAAPAAAEEPAEKQAPAADAAAEASRLLISAQKVYNDTVAQAKQEAERILKDARGSVSEKNKDLEAERDTLENELKTLRRAAKEYREHFIALVDGQKDLLDEAKELFDEESNA